MCPARKKFSPKSEVLSFTYPKLHTGKSWYVDFFSLDPATGTMRRKKYMLDSIEKITERRKRAAELTESLLKLLRSGWSPWVNVDDNRGYSLLSDALDKYEKSVEKMPKLKTRQSYLSCLNVMREYRVSGFFRLADSLKYNLDLLCKDNVSLRQNIAQL